MSFVICDTNIFIHAFNGDLNTTAALDKIQKVNILMPSIAAMELIRGMRNQVQLAKMTKRIKVFNVLQVNENVSRKAVELIRTYRLSHDLQIPDAIIAALAVEYGFPLFTYNTKDFHFIPGLKLYQIER